MTFFLYGRAQPKDKQFTGKQLREGYYHDEGRGDFRLPDCSGRLGHLGIVCTRNECPAPTPEPTAEPTPTPPPGPDPTPRRCPYAKSGLSENARITGQTPTHWKIAIDTTARFGPKNANRGLPCNDDKIPPNYVRHCGGRMCDPHQTVLKLDLRASRGVRRLRQSPNNGYFVWAEVPKGIGTYWVEACMARGNPSQAGDILRLMEQPCKKVEYRTP